MKHLKEQVNSPRRKITGDSSWVVLLLIAICYTFRRRKTFSPTYSPPHHKTGVSAGALKPKFSHCACENHPYSHVGISDKNIHDLKEHRDLFLLHHFGAEEENVSLSGWHGTKKRSVESLTWLWKDKTPWSQLGLADTLWLRFAPSQGTSFLLSY